MSRTGKKVENLMPISEVVQLAHTKGTKDTTRNSLNHDSIQARREIFCHEYLRSGDCAFAYRSAFGIAKEDAEKYQVKNAFEFLRTTEVQQMLSDSLELAGFNSFVMDRELLRIATKGSTDLVRLNAIRLFHELRGKIINRIDITAAPKYNLGKLSDEELLQFHELLEKGNSSE